jgi:VWFA-related protein
MTERVHSLLLFSNKPSSPDRHQNHTMRSIITPTIYTLFAIFLTSTLLSAQTPTRTPKIEEETEVVKVESRLIVVPVAVTNAAGEPMTGLTQQDFRLSEEGKNQTIESVATADAVPLEIALLFDVSASTDAMFRFQQETAAKFLQDVLRPNDRATIFSIGQTPILVKGRETATVAVAAVKSVSATKGATAFFDTVRSAAEYLRLNTPQGHRKVMIVISDGEDNFSVGVQKAQRRIEGKIVSNQPDPDFKRLRSVIAQAQETAKIQERVSVVKALQDGDIVLYSINPGGSSYHLNSISKFGQENMEKFAADTGGTAFLPKFSPVDTPNALQNGISVRKNTEVLERIFKQLASELRAQYLVQYYSDGNFANGKFVKLQVGLTNRNDLSVRARQGYYVKN